VYRLRERLYVFTTFSDAGLGVWLPDPWNLRLSHSRPHEWTRWPELENGVYPLDDGIHLVRTLRVIPGFDLDMLKSLVVVHDRVNWCVQMFEIPVGQD